MMKKTLSIALISLLYISCFSQEKLLTINDAIVGQFRELYPEYLMDLQWRGENSSIVHQDYNTIFENDFSKKPEKELLDIQTLNQAFASNNIDTLERLPHVKFLSNDEVFFEKDSSYCFYSLSKGTFNSIITIPENAGNYKLIPSKYTIAYTMQGNVYIAFKNGTHKQITFDNKADVVNGETVSRNEFNISGGLFWSNDGKKLAFYRKDHSKVKDYPIVDITAREAEVSPIKYPMAGMSSEHISLGVYDIGLDNIVFIEKEDTVSEKYLTNITWAPDDKSIYIQVLNRQQNEMNLNNYSSTTGTLNTTLFTETHDKYVEPLNELIFTNKQGKEFIYQSRKDGYNHAYLYNIKGEFIKQVTKGSWEITTMHGIDGNYIYYTATKESPIERHVYKTSIKDGSTIKLTTKKGTHKAIFDPNYKHFIDNFSSIEVPRIIQVTDTDGNNISTLKEATNPLKGYDMPKMEIGTIKSADNETDLYYRIIKPIDFDSTKSYPVVIYVYGGPHAQMINNRWLAGARMWQYYMAQKGYVMFTVDNRGSANRGLEFENIIHRQAGVNEMADQMEGVKFLKNLNYIDSTRIGIHGWSYGGFMTTSLMVNEPNTFKVGCAGGPVIDWKYYEAMYGERYMDSPEENPEGYTYTSLVPRAKDLEGKLLMIHGAVDPVVVMQHSQIFVRECIKNNVEIDYFIYPRAEHNVRGYDRIHLMKKVTNYFDDYLKQE